MSAPCYWCGAPYAETKDHLIPSWALRTFPELKDHQERNLVRACIRCNSAKGPMPAAVFAEVRLDVRALKTAQRHWNLLRLQIHEALETRMLLKEKLDPLLYDHVLAEMKRDFSHSPFVGQPWKKAKAKVKLKRPDRPPVHWAATSGVVVIPRHENLNENLETPLCQTPSPVLPAKPLETPASTLATAPTFWSRLKSLMARCFAPIRRMGSA